MFKTEKMCIVILMAKRITGIEKRKTTHSKKTQKRLAKKKKMLELKALKPAARKKALQQKK